MRSLVIPTIFANDRESFNKRFDSLTKISKYLHIDIMDGFFVKDKSIDVGAMPVLSGYGNLFEAHLMVLDPGSYVSALRSKGFKKAILHYESFKNDKERFDTLAEFNRARLYPFLALNPETPIEAFMPFLDYIKGILIMGVHPGKEHQQMVNGTIEKVKEALRLEPRIVIQVDGGVNIGNIKLLKNAGVSIVNTGSFVSEAENPKEALKTLQASFL